MNGGASAHRLEDDIEPPARDGGTGVDTCSDVESMPRWLGLADHGVDLRALDTGQLHQEGTDTAGSAGDEEPPPAVGGGSPAARMSRRATMPASGKSPRSPHPPPRVASSNKVGDCLPFRAGSEHEGASRRHTEQGENPGSRSRGLP